MNNASLELKNDRRSEKTNKKYKQIEKARKRIERKLQCPSCKIKIIKKKRKKIKIKYEFLRYVEEETDLTSAEDIPEAMVSNRSLKFGTNKQLSV